MLNIKKTKYQDQNQIHSQNFLPVVQTIPVAALILAGGSVGLDYLRHLNIDYFLSTHYGFIFLIYLYGWITLLYCGRIITFLCLILNFLVFTISLSYAQPHHIALTYTNILPFIKNIFAYIKPDLLDNAHFWIGGGIVVLQMIWLAPRSFLNIINAGCLISLIILSTIFFRIVGYPKQLWYPLWPGVYDTLYKENVNQDKKPKTIPISPNNQIN